MSCWGGPNLLFWLKSEARRRRWAEARGPKDQEWRWGSRGWDSQPLITSYGACGSAGSAVCSHSEVRDGVLAANRFSRLLKAPDGLSWNLLGPSSRGHGPIAHSLNPPIHAWLQPLAAEDVTMPQSVISLCSETTALNQWSYCLMQLILM